MRLIPSILVLLVLPLVALPTPSQAARSYDSCTGFVTSVPATITTQGNWCLSADLSTAVNSGWAISIATNNVTLDCNDFKIGGIGAGVSTAANGIQATDRLNVTVRNCNIRGFYHGVYFNGGGGHLIEDNALDSNRYAGIRVSGDGSTIRRNRVFATGGSLVTTHTAFGIVTLGTADILDNVVNQVAPYSPTGTANGIFTNQNFSGSIRRNFVRGLFAQDGDNVRAIDTPNSTRVMILDNVAQHADPAGGTAIRCGVTAASARRNVMIGFAQGVLVCAPGDNLHLAL